jgi:hypothetical protein
MVGFVVLKKERTWAFFSEIRAPNSGNYLMGEVGEYEI